MFELDAQTWTVTGLLDADSAGFGKLYEVASENGAHAVAKVVKKAPGAKRELLIADSVAAAQFHSVMPIIDTGEHGDSWVLVMPRAERSLAQHIAKAGGTLLLVETIQILKDIADALSEIDGAIVHRDLKPANVLFHDGTWKLADFGIARYNDASTADSTRKGSLSPPYAAPEQWESRHATSATDVYAFGIIAYELVAGTLPFQGPRPEDFREQHLKTTAPELSAGTAKLRILIEECLYKAPEVRPQPRALLARIESAENAADKSGTSKLAAFSHQLVRERSLQQAELAAHRDTQEQHRLKVQAADQSLQSIARLIREEIVDNAPTAVFANIVGNAAPIFRVELGRASLTFDRAEPVEHWDQPFVVIAGASIEVSSSGSGEKLGWTGSLFMVLRCPQRRPVWLV